MCTVVTRWEAGELLDILAIRDELVSRAFDPPGEWWPDHPGVVGGRDRLAGGSWCVSDVRRGVTALVLNRPERRTGTPSRGVLPLAAVAAGTEWTQHVDHREMAGFNLVLAGPTGVSMWTWDAVELRRTDLSPGTHVFTPRGVDGDDPKASTFRPRFEQEDWLDVVTSLEPQDEISALVVRHSVGDDTYATVFGQLISARPGSLGVAHSRTPWRAGTWSEQRWP